MKVPSLVALLMGTVTITVLALIVAFPDVALAGHAPVGVDAYCDRVRPGGALADPQLLHCEDWEAPTLHDDVNLGGGPPKFGPPYDAGGGARGDNGYWVQMYGYPGFSCLWNLNRPPSPQRGVPCAGGPCGMPIYHPTNLWDGNADSAQTQGELGQGAACVAFPRTGEFNSEVGGLSNPGHAVGGTSGAFDGRQVLAHRVRQGRLNDIVGFVSFGAPRKNIGITMAVAYPTNSATSGIWDSPWKHNEWTVGGLASEGWFLFHNTPPFQDSDPFQQFFFNASCSARLASANRRLGFLFCDAGDNLLFWPDPTVYRRSRDWPLGQWGCVRGHLTGVGTGTMTVKIWFQGPNDSAERLIIDFDYNGIGLSNAVGYDGFAFNAYANANQGFLGGGETPTSVTTYRYEDNIHIRQGTPVSCAQIGYAGQAVPPAPSQLDVR